MGYCITIQCLDAQTQALGETHAGPVQQLRHERVHTRNLLKEQMHLVTREDWGQVFGRFGAHCVNWMQRLDVEHLAVQEEEGSEGT